MRLMGRHVDRSTAILAAAGVAALVVLVVLLGQLSRAQGRLASLESARDDMFQMKGEYAVLNGKVKALERKRGLTRVTGVVQAVDTVFEPLGLKEKVESVKPTGSDDPREEKAEVTLEGVSTNEMVNILYTIENSPMLLLVKKMELKTSFLNPEQLNMTITLSFIKPE